MAINLNSSRMRRMTGTEEISDLVDRAALDKAARETRRRYVGASGIGGPCERQTQFEYMGTQPDEDWEDNPNFIRIRKRGHVYEDEAISWLVDAGFEFQAIEPGKQLRFVAADGEFSGGVDGVITGGPLDLPYPFLWEHKALGAKSWGEIDQRGVRKAKPVYAAQIAVYQAYLELESPCLFQATNMDSMRIIFEWVPFDPVLAQVMSDRAVNIILDTKSGILRPRISIDSTKYPCTFCKFKNRCFSKRGI
jgi:hypothetical protein